MSNKAALFSTLLSALLCLCLAATLSGQTAAPVQKAIGTIQSISKDTVTLKTDSGSVLKVLVEDTTKILRAVPGASLKDATPVSIQDLRPGDRILVHGVPGDNQALAGRLIIAMTRSDIAQKQQQQMQQWRNGVGGLVKSVNPSASTATISTTTATGAKDVVVRFAKATIVRRYAPNSVKFDDAKPGTLDEIHPGDQLRARGTKNADGTELAADEVVSGTFHNIAGLISSVDSAKNTIIVNDLATKKLVTIDINADSQMHKLPPFLAQHLAMQLKAAPQNGAAPQGAHADVRPGMEHRPEGGPGPGPGEARPGDLSQMLNRMPAVTLADLAKGEAVMIVTTSDSTAITLLTGVESILTASPNGSGAASLLTPWSLGSGGADAAGGDVPQ